MIFKIFRTEWKNNLRISVLGLLACAAAFAAFGIAGAFGGDAFAARMAEVGFLFSVAVSYVVPLLLLVFAVAGCNRKYYRLAGVRGNVIAAGEMFSVFAWTAVFILAEILLTTAFDCLCFIGRDVVRSQVYAPCMILSLRAHGALRLLFAPSAGVSMAVLLLICDVIRVTAVRTRSLVGKIAAVIVAVYLIAWFQFVVLQLSAVFYSFSDASPLLMPDSVLPVQGLIHWIWYGVQDSVKGAHLFSAPILNAAYLIGEFAFCVLAWGYLSVLKRCKNEIETH